MTKLPKALTRRVLIHAPFWLIAAGAAPAMAGPESLRDGLFGARRADGRPHAAPPVARYVSEDGAVFILDRSQPQPFLKFEDSAEVWALAPQPAPRGDVIYKNDLGQPMLRATRLGGVTLFTEARPGGSAAALAGEGGPPLRMAPLGPQALAERLLQASARASRAARRLIPFDADATPASSALIADAALIVSEAIGRASRRPNAPILLNRLRQVRLVEGRKAAASLDQGALKITVAPGDGLAGRPSSTRIVAVIVAAR
jgi:Domain of unknown function (DUF4908)